jgi:hypothetical protein
LPNFTGDENGSKLAEILGRGRRHTGDLSDGAGSATTRKSPACMVSMPTSCEKITGMPSAPPAPRQIPWSLATGKSDPVRIRASCGNWFEAQGFGLLDE